jgi:hypothetical protein
MYVSNGILRKKRPCGPWLIPALMWSIFNLIGLFFQTMYWGHKPRRRQVESRQRPRLHNNIIQSIRPAPKGG